MPPRCAAASCTGAALPGLRLRWICSHDGSVPPRMAEAVFPRNSLGHFLTQTTSLCKFAKSHCTCSTF